MYLLDLDPVSSQPLLYPDPLMALLTLVEAAMESGYSVELLEALAKNCPKSQETRRLKTAFVDKVVYIDKDELEAYRRWLREPWSTTPGAQRPRIPDYIKQDIRAEAHHRCAICSAMDNGQVAHIDPSAETRDNSPENLLLLCPSHHVKYDEKQPPGEDIIFAPNPNNVSREAIIHAKGSLQRARRRMLRFEHNVVEGLRVALQVLRKVEQESARDLAPDVRQVYITETKALLETIADLADKAQEAAAGDQDFTAAQELVKNAAPEIFRSAQAARADQRHDSDVRSVAQEVVHVAGAVFELDDIECPRCHGRGQTGLVGDVCDYCRGTATLTQAEADVYDPDAFDDAECPRCHGSGQTGLSGSLCAFCGGRCRVSSEDAATYTEDSVDEVACPHCDGRGQTGLVSDSCAYCNGDCFVSSATFAAYDRAQIDEVDCPHCQGRGQTGLVNDTCAYCHGRCVVSHERHDAYDPAAIDEVACPCCHGSGRRGMSFDVCLLCGGSTVVGRATAAAYREQSG